MAPIYKIAVIQLYPKPLQPEFNFAKACDFIRSAAAQGAHLAVLPEYHLTNWLPTASNFREACSSWQEYLGRYQTLAKELDICIVPGTIVETVDEGQSPTQFAQVNRTEKHDAVHDRENTRVPGLVNVAYFIDNKGSILSRYVKVNLWGTSERPYLTSAGRAPHVAFDTPLGRMGLLICWDLAFPEAWRELIADGAKIICLPTFWTLSNPNDAGLKWNVDAERIFVDTTVTARACENTCAVIMANAGGPRNKPSKLYQGDSCVTVPFLGPISKIAGPSEGMIIANLDMQIVEDAEKDYQIRADLARADWHYDYRHTSDEFAVKQNRPKL